MNEQQIIDKLNYFTERYGSDGKTSSLGYAAAIRDVKDFIQSLQPKEQEKFDNIKSLSDKIEEDKKANAILWEMAEEITQLQRKAKELNTTNVMWKYLEEDWFDWLEEKFNNYANANNSEAMNQPKVDEGFIEWVLDVNNEIFYISDTTKDIYGFPKIGYYKVSETFICGTTQELYNIYLTNREK